jgi:hypothetical protein
VSADLELTVERGTVEPGLTFSEDAINHAGDEFLNWVLAQLVGWWDDTDIPPTSFTVNATIQIH